MTLNLCVLTPNRIVWDSEVKEIILSTNSGQIGVLPNHAPIATAVDIGILRIRLNDQWLTMALMGGFARIGNNEITVLVNDAEKGSDIDPREGKHDTATTAREESARACPPLETRTDCPGETPEVP